MKILLLFTISLLSFAQTTNVTGTLVDQIGAAFNGNLVVTPISSTVQGGPVTYVIAAGRMSVFLTPATYQAQIIGAGRTTRSIWIVPSSLTPVDYLSITSTTGAGTGTVLPKTFYMEAANCVSGGAVSNLDQFTSNAPPASCPSSTNVPKGVLTYAATGSTLAYYTIKVPQGATSLQDFTVLWSTAGVTGNMKWFIGVSCTKLDGTQTDDQVFTFVSILTTASSTTNAMRTSSIASVAGCGGNTLMHVALKRDKSDAADTLSSSVSLTGVEGVLYVAQ